MQRDARAGPESLFAGMWRQTVDSGEREFFIDNLLFRIHYIIVMIKWTGLARWEFEFPFPSSLTSTFWTVDTEWVGAKGCFFAATVWWYRGTSLIRNTHPPMTTTGP